MRTGSPESWPEIVEIRDAEMALEVHVFGRTYPTLNNFAALDSHRSSRSVHPFGDYE